jgi:hypothetical protein
MRRLFRSFEAVGLEYLLISGQASILYGAATFSEDIDIWIRPTPANAVRLLRALAACQATVYKLTPRLTRCNLGFGHGFHFLVPDRAGPVYLDVMGRPPRVGSFAVARRRADLMSTPWGRIPVVGIDDLIALKLTKRLSDYEVISNLVRIRVAAAPADPALLRWAVAASFRAEDRAEFARRLGETASEEAHRAAILAEIAAHQATRRTGGRSSTICGRSGRGAACYRSARPWLHSSAIDLSRDR